MSEIPDNLVKQGFWINWSQGSVLGATITTTARVSNVVVALLAVLISLAAIHLWHLLVFCYYQYRVDNPKKDELFKQQQVLLRTLPSPDTVIVDFLRLGWVWRSKARNAPVRCLFPCAAALAFILASVAAGIFSSLVVSTTNLQVLVNSPTCGFPPEEEVANITASIAQEVNRVSEYSRVCDPNKPNLPSTCDVFVEPKILFSTKAEKCPFESSTCIGSGDVAVALDTGLLDSNDIFGINIEQNERVKIRYKTTCAPLGVSDRITLGKSLPDPYRYLQGEQMWYFHYGTGFGGAENYTWAHSTYTSNLTLTYTLGVGMQYANKHVLNRDWKFFPEFRRSDGDTVLIFVEPNSVLYQVPVYDPVFFANTSFVYDSTEFFRPNNPTGVVGCVEQVQFCLPSHTGSNYTCSTLGGVPNDPLGLFPHATEIQKSTIYLLLYPKISIYDVYVPKPAQLKASQSVDMNGYQEAYLPQNQWALESQGWFTYFLFQIQNYVTQYAQGSQSHKTSLYTAKPQTPGEKYICRSVKMNKTGGFANINVLGLGIVIGVSAFLVIMDIATLKSFIYLKKIRKIMARRIDAWIQDGVLQLQRKAFEAHGFETWVRLDKEIPLTGAHVQSKGLGSTSSSSTSS